jgi:hypothetical protein
MKLNGETLDISKSLLPYQVTKDELIAIAEIGNKKCGLGRMLEIDSAIVNLGDSGVRRESCYVSNR